MQDVNDTYRIIGLGNALVDVVAHVEPEIIGRHGLEAGGMHLVEDDAATALYGEVGPGLRQSGGSVANTIAHASRLGAGTIFIGKVAEDELGDAFAEDFAGLGVRFETPRLSYGQGTGRCVVMVTPDGERTMSTYLGAAQSLNPADVEASMPGWCDMLLVEGYIWDSPGGAEAIDSATSLARAAGARIALTPSDAGCVARNADEMRAFVERDCDILVGNEAEIRALADTETAAEALSWASALTSAAAVTQSEAGSLVANGHGSVHVPAVSVAEVVDTTGAGDAYAAGFLSVLAAGGEPVAAGHLGASLAARVVGHYGARQRDDATT